MARHPDFVNRVHPSVYRVVGYSLHDLVLRENFESSILLRQQILVELFYSLLNCWHNDCIMDICMHDSIFDVVVGGNFDELNCKQILNFVLRYISNCWFNENIREYKGPKIDIFYQTKIPRQNDKPGAIFSKEG